MSVGLSIVKYQPKCYNKFKDCHQYLKEGCATPLIIWSVQYQIKLRWHCWPIQCQSFVSFSSNWINFKLQLWNDSKKRQLLNFPKLETILSFTKSIEKYGQTLNKQHTLYHLHNKNNSLWKPRLCLEKVTCLMTIQHLIHWIFGSAFYTHTYNT